MFALSDKHAAEFKLYIININSILFLFSSVFRIWAFLAWLESGIDVVSDSFNMVWSDGDSI